MRHVLIAYFHSDIAELSISLTAWAAAQVPRFLWAPNGPQFLRAGNPMRASFFLDCTV